MLVVGSRLVVDLEAARQTPAPTAVAFFILL
jgi:hypothetical protein